MQVLVNTDELSPEAKAEVEGIAAKRRAAARARAKSIREITVEHTPNAGGGANDAKKFVPRVGSDPVADGEKTQQPMQSGAEVRLAE